MILKCYPVCECGHVFKELYSYTGMIQVSENHYKEIRTFNPEKCPECNSKIEKLELPTYGYGGGIRFGKEDRKPICFRPNNETFPLCLGEIEEGALLEICSRCDLYENGGDK